LIPAVADRWGYHLRTLEAGRLLDEPIPQIALHDAVEKAEIFLAHPSGGRILLPEPGARADAQQGEPPGSTGNLVPVLPGRPFS
jgi:hypothetical protein